MDLRSLFQEHAAYVWASLRRLGVPASDLDDLTQEVFMTVHALREDFDPARPFRPWAFGIAYRITLRHRRARAKLDVPSDDLAGDVASTEPTPFDALSQKQTRDLVTAAINRVEIHRRAVLILKDIDDHSVPEIAQSLGIELNTAYSRLRLAREDFAAEMRRLRGAKELSS